MSNEVTQLTFEGIELPWEEEWIGMPEFCQHDLEAKKRLIINFSSLSDYFEFSKVIDIKLTTDTRSIWYPPAEIERVEHKRWRSES